MALKFMPLDKIRWAEGIYLVMVDQKKFNLVDGCEKIKDNIDINDKFIEQCYNYLEERGITILQHHITDDQFEFIGIRPIYYE